MSSQDPTDKSQVVSLVGVSASTAVGTLTPWLSYCFAPEWFDDAVREAQIGLEHHSRRREIVFALCAAESYLLEWVRDEVLNRDFQKLNRYFPPGKWRSVSEKWKEIPKQLFDDGLIANLPNFNDPYWEKWLELIEYRNGLIHARSSRPETASIAEKEKPIPSKTTLDNLQAGWALRIVVELIKQLHKAAGTSPPSWLQLS
jgi:hypothetical protein